MVWAQIVVGFVPCSAEVLGFAVPWEPVVAADQGEGTLASDAGGVKILAGEVAEAWPSGLGRACYFGSSSSVAGLEPAEPAPVVVPDDESVAAYQPGSVPVVPTTAQASFELLACRFPSSR